MMRALCGGALALLAPLLVAAAQSVPSRPRPEFRLDATDGRPAALQALGGAIVPVGNYLRLTLSAGGGVARGEGGTAIGSLRAESTARFLLDPFRQSRAALSAGGGVTLRHEPGVGTRGFLVLLLDLETRPHGDLAQAIQLGLGGGVRVAVVLRGIAPGRR